MPAPSPMAPADADTVVLARGRLRVEIALRPLELTIRRGGRRLVRSMGAWVADGTVHDHFIQLTEGVVAAEELAPLERAAAARVGRLAADRAVLAVELNGGRRARLEVRVLADDRVSFELEPEGEPLRVAADWRRRSDEHFVGLGARHGTQFDQAGRAIQLGADRRYTGPDCPPTCSPAGGSRKATTRRCRGSSRAVAMPCGSGRTPTGSGSTSPATASRRRLGAAPGRSDWTSCAIRRRRRGCGRSAA